MRSQIRPQFVLIVVMMSVALSAPVILSQGDGRSVGFGVVGDTGQIGLGQRRVAQQLKAYRDRKSKIEFALMLGDNVYPDGVGRGLKAHFEEPFGDLLKDGFKFYAVLGNHDIRRGAETQIKYDKFNMDGRNFYSFTKGDDLIEFFAIDSTVLDTEVDRLEKGEIKTLERGLSALKRIGRPTRRHKEQIEDISEEIKESEEFIEKREEIATKQFPWLIEALAKSKARWKVVFMHHSLYSSAHKRGGHGKNAITLRLRATLEPVFLSNKVDVVFGGHDHTYERSKPQPADSPGGYRIQYFTVGASSKLRAGDLDRRSPCFADGEDRKYSFLVATVTDSVMKIEAIDAAGQTIDRADIPKQK